VRGYFVHTYGRYGAEMWNPYISWFNPVLLGIAALSFVVLLLFRRTWPRIDRFCRWRAGVLGSAALVTGAVAIAWQAILMRAAVPFGGTAIAVNLLLALAFKLLVILVIWQALKASGTSSGSGNTRDVSWMLLVVVAAGIHLILPVRHYLISLIGPLVPNSIPSWLWPHATSLWSFIVDSVLALLIARFLLVRGATDGVLVLSGASRTVHVAFWFAVAFLLLTPIVAVLGAIPYGGGGIPKEVKSLLAVTEIIGIYLIYRGLLRGAA
jgi:hypothetical protein